VSGAASRPLFSVIVPVHRHWDLLPGLLAALAAQDLGAFELVVVNNDAPAAPPPLALPGNARLVDCAAPGSYAARNAGAAAARGRWLAFTDADCQPVPGWLAAFAAAEAASGGGLLAGPVEMAAPAAPNAFAAYDLVRGIPQARYVARGYATTANLALPAALFRALGGFDPARRSGGDAAFCRRAGAAGHPLTLVPGAVVRHPCRDSWEALRLKARRIKGGQIRAGPLPRRAAWMLRTLAPPLRDTAHYLASPHPAPQRRAAVAVRFRLWGVEVAEMLRLLAGGDAERR
jgi:GT2 family glycosyltransferase